MQKKPIYFTGLALENVRAFGEKQQLALTNKSGAPAQWTLIIGENGVGKTTLLQCIAKMRPAPKVNVRNEITKLLQPAFLDEPDTATFDALVRKGRNVTLQMRATMSIGVKLDSQRKPTNTIFTELTVERQADEVEKIAGRSSKIEDFEEPLIIGYSASRHMGYSKSIAIAAAVPDPVNSLFDASLELLDAEEILEQLDYAHLKGIEGAEDLFKRVRGALATLLPDINSPEDILVAGPRTLSLKGKKGVYAKTPYGMVPFSSLSLGYQTVSAWAIDIAWRLFQKYPESESPLLEPAIVLVDEIDLHLHPKWQRKIRKDLSEHFPNVQFIATAHSPLMAQTYLDANLAVIRREGDHALIINDPEVVQNWRVDQIVTSELFELSARSPEVEEKMQRRVALINKAKLTNSEKQELKELDRESEGFTPLENKQDSEALAFLRDAANYLK